jgi:hypothetical protein
MRESKTGDRHRKLTAEKITQKRAEGENQMSTQVDAKIQAAVIRIRVAWCGVWSDLLDEYDNEREDNLWDAYELFDCSSAANAIDLNPMDIRNTTHLCS